MRPHRPDVVYRRAREGHRSSTCQWWMSIALRAGGDAKSARSGSCPRREIVWKLAGFSVATSARALGVPCIRRCTAPCGQFCGIRRRGPGKPPGRAVRAGERRAFRDSIPQGRARSASRETSNSRCGADGGTRTRTGFPRADFKSAASTFSPRPLRSIRSSRVWVRAAAGR